MKCDICGKDFEPTPENPGTTFVGGYPYPDDERSEELTLCDDDVRAFLRMEPAEQYAIVERILQERQEQAAATEEPEAQPEP